MRNLAWAFETFNAAGKAAPSAAALRAEPARRRTQCLSGAGVTFTSVPAKQTVNVDDGAAWVFRAPAGTTVKRVQVWRNAATAASVDDAGTGGVENGWWTLYARAGDTVAGRVVLAAETCPGNTPTAARHRLLPQGRRQLPGHDAGHLRHRRARRELGRAVHRADDHLAVLHRQRRPSGYAHLHLQAAIVTVDDPVAAGRRLRPARGRRPAHERDLHRQRHRLGRRPLAARARRRRRARRRALRRATSASPRPARAPRSRDFDLAGVPDGRHTRDHDRRGRRQQRHPHRAGRSTSTARRPSIDRVPGQRPQRLRARRRRRLRPRGRDDRGARRHRRRLHAVEDDAARRAPDGATVPRSFSMSSLGIQVSVADRAGNAFTSVVTSMSLSTRVGKGSSRKVRNERATIGYGRAVTVLGRLTTVDGSPLADQEIVLSGTERRAGAAAADLARVRTDTGGRFRVTVPAGPSRDVTVRYPGAARPPAPLARGQPCASRPARRSAPPAPRCAARARSASPAACAPSAPRCRRAARSSTSRPPSAAAGRPSPPPAPAAPPAPGAPSHASAAPRAATRSGCASAARRCSPTNWGTPLPWWYASVENRRSFSLWRWPWWSPSPASAGTYDVVTCSPSGPGGVNNAWVARPGRTLRPARRRPRSGCAAVRRRLRNRRRR